MKLRKPYLGPVTTFSSKETGLLKSCGYIKKTTLTTCSMSTIFTIVTAYLLLSTWITLSGMMITLTPMFLISLNHTNISLDPSSFSQYAPDLTSPSLSCHSLSGALNLNHIISLLPNVSFGIWKVQKACASSLVVWITTILFKASRIPTGEVIHPRTLLFQATAGFSLED